MHLVVVADAEDVGGRAGRQAHEQHVGGREVLELVDEEVAVVGLHGPAQLAVPQQGLDGAEDLLVEVDRAPPAQLVAVRLVGRGEARHVVERVLHLLRVAAGRGG